MVLLQCPYVPAHQVEDGTRMQTHLKRCRKQILDDVRSPFHANAKKISVCKYNPMHHIHTDKMDDHVKNECDSVKSILMTVNQKKTEVPEWKRELMAPEPQQATRTSWDDDDDEEDWDSAPSVQPYDPMEKVENSRGAILHNVQGMTDSERRHYRREKRMQYEDQTRGPSGVQGTQTVQAGNVRDTDQQRRGPQVNAWEVRGANHSQSQQGPSGPQRPSLGRGRGTPGDLSSQFQNVNVGSARPGAPARTDSNNPWGRGRGRGNPWNK